MQSLCGHQVSDYYPRISFLLYLDCTVVVRSVPYVQSYFHISKYKHHVLLKANKAAGLCPKTAGKHLSARVQHFCAVKIMAICREGRTGYENSY